MCFYRCTSDHFLVFSLSLTGALCTSGHFCFLTQSQQELQIDTTSSMQLTQCWLLKQQTSSPNKQTLETVYECWNALRAKNATKQQQKKCHYRRQQLLCVLQGTTTQYPRPYTTLFHSDQKCNIEMLSVSCYWIQLQGIGDMGIEVLLIKDHTCPLSFAHPSLSVNQSHRSVTQQCYGHGTC